MSRTPLFHQFSRTIRIAWFAERHSIATHKALERVAEVEGNTAQRRSRRDFFGRVAGLAASTVIASLAGPVRRAHAAPGGGSGAGHSIGIVGAGMAGLACADRLGSAGIFATVYEAMTDRVGGRVRSLPGVFPGRTIELGGEYLDYWHKTMLAYVRRFGLTRIDLFATSAEVLYRIDGATYPESMIIDAFRDVVLRMRKDMRSVTSGIGARNFDAAPGSADLRLDNTNLEQYLQQIGAAGILVKAIRSVFGGEYGQELHRQSALNFILFAKLARSKSRIVYFGANNAERYAVAEGNEAIAHGLRDDLLDAGGSVEDGMRLTGLKKTADGRYELSFGTTTRTHDAVVLAIPATVIRTAVTLDANLGIAAQTRAAIAGLQYGDNTKTMFQFGSSQPFDVLGGDGSAYATDPALPNVQVAFPSKTAAPGADPTKPVVVDYGFGERGRLLLSADPDGTGFLHDYGVIFPGASAAAVPLLNGEPFARAHWPSDPNALGSYTCNQPGYFTTMEGWLGEPAGNLAFAGEHTDSFHNFQGFIEGAAQSGIRAAEYLLDRARRGLL